MAQYRPSGMDWKLLTLYVPSNAWTMNLWAEMGT